MNLVENYMYILSYLHSLPHQVACLRKSDQLLAICLIHELLDTAQYLVAVKIRDRVSVRKCAVQQFDKEIFNLKKLNDVEVKKTVTG
jgi:hypothetical protein